MPRKKGSSLGRKTPKAKSTQLRRQNETQEQTSQRQEEDRSWHEEARGRESAQQKSQRQEQDKLRHEEFRQNQSAQQKSQRHEQDRLWHEEFRQNQSAQQISQRREQDRLWHEEFRQNQSAEQISQRREQDRLRHEEVRENESAQQKSQRLQQQMIRSEELRQSESEQQKSQRQEQDRIRHEEVRHNETPVRRSERLQQMRMRNEHVIQNESEDERQARLDQQRVRMINFRASAKTQWNLAAFRYDPTKAYALDPVVNISLMTHLCTHCGAQKWANERPGLCCRNGKVNINPLSSPPEPLKSLLLGQSSESKHFLQNIQRYNTAFEMTSFGAKVIQERGWMPTFKIQGKLCHRIGSLLPLHNEEPQFLQLYFVGDMRLQAQKRSNFSAQTDTNIIQRLQEMLHAQNSYIKSFKYAKEIASPTDHKIHIDADKRPTGEHARRFNAPECNEVAVIMTGEEHGKRDIVLHGRDNRLQRITETHRSYDALQYPLLFVQGEDGYHFGIPHAGDSNKTVSCMDFYSHLFMVRPNSFNHLHRSQRLFLQFAVDMYAKVEAERMAFIASHQDQLRSDSYIHLRDNINNDVAGSDIGRVKILPSTFVGGPRYMHERTQDAMTYVQKYGTPDLFITKTCNPHWQEIKDVLLPGQTHNDRHDLIARVFRLKVVKMIDLITKGELFGSVRCYMYTIEWQKRGLPHAHLLVWLKTKLHANDMDKIISAELPDPNKDPDLYKIVLDHMPHGPCGRQNMNSVCMEDGKCSKRYPRKFVRETQTGEDGYPTYRRRSPQDGGFTGVKGTGIRAYEVDNQWIVPYSPILLKTFNAHINVEFCNSVKSIKYVCKYINKGSDAAMFAIRDQQEPINELNDFQQGRYICSNEAFWRIFGFPIHERYPMIQQLAVHDEGEQNVYFTAATARDRAMNPKDTTLTAFFKLCQRDTFAETLYYNQLPSFYTWNKDKREWKRRKQGDRVPGYPDIRFDSALGRVYTVHPNQEKRFHMRILLHEVKGPKSFEDLRSVNGIVCPTYRDACLQRGLLADDSQWDATLSEASVLHTPRRLRILFAMMLNVCGISDPASLWIKFRDDLSEDFLHQCQIRNPDIEVRFSDEIYNNSLIDIENRLISMGGNELSSYGLPQSVRGRNNELSSEILRETSYNIDALTQFLDENGPKLLEDQKAAYQTIIDTVKYSPAGGIFFLDAPGGTGKTFVIKLLLAKVRQQNRIALAVASSGIAATLLPGGRTAHSTFKLPLDMYSTDRPVCNVSKNSGTGELLRRCSLIVWDECTMINKVALEAVDRTLRDIKGNNLPMGGTTLVLSGDFRQTLPVIPKGTRADEVRSCFKSSMLWPKIKTIKLHTNMRAHLFGDASSGQFARDLLQLGDGNVRGDLEGYIDPSPICNMVTSVQALVDNVFPNISLHYLNHSWLCERAILAPKNSTVSAINFQLLKQIPGIEKTYKSVDTVANQSDGVNYPIEFLNSLNPSGLPPHKLDLRIGAPIMLLRNLNPPKLCNGTRLAVKKLMPHLIEATVLTGCGKGECVFIPRIPLIPSDVPFQFKRLQFPVRLSFAMSINKSQGQTLSVAGLHLEEPCFSHGQFYVGCSRVGRKSSLFIYTPSKKTKNIVYKEVL